MMARAAILYPDLHPQMPVAVALVQPGCKTLAPLQIIEPYEKGNTFNIIETGEVAYALCVRRNLEAYIRRVPRRSVLVGDLYTLRLRISVV